MSAALFWIDGHLDLAYLAVNGRDIRRPLPDNARGCVSLPALRAARIDLAFATIFTAPGGGAAGQPQNYTLIDEAEAAGMRQLEVYEALETESELSIVRCRADLDRAAPLPKVLLLMENADPIRAPEHVARWRERGLAIVGLTWAIGSRYAGGNATGGPLTARGREMIAALDEAGIVHDVAHLSDAAFDGVMDAARGPVIASHSNCRALLDPKERHLRDDQIRALGERGGIVGLNLYSKFLAVDRRATIADCVAHLNRVADLMGHRRGVALGSDMDGGFDRDALPEGLDHPTKLNALADALRSAGWSEDEVRGFAHDNWRAFLERVLDRHHRASPRVRL